MTPNPQEPMSNASDAETARALMDKWHAYLSENPFEVHHAEELISYLAAALKKAREEARREAIEECAQLIRSCVFKNGLSVELLDLANQIEAQLPKDGVK